MRCNKHPCDLSSIVGVCSSCLRERLSALIAAQVQLQQQEQQQIAQLAKAQHHSRATVIIDESRKSYSNSQHHRRRHQPPPLIFPRSVSPYVCRRKSDDDDDNDYDSWSAHNQHHNLRFYSTPAEAPSSSSPSWLSTIFSGRRRKPSPQLSMEYSGSVCGEPRQRLDRGMSPARGADSEYCENCDRSPSGSVYSPESSPGWKKTPVPKAAMRRGKPGHTRNMSGLTFCLSPLVRASPSRNRSQNGGLPPEVGELRAPAKPHLSTAASFCANRSRKLADFGRVNHNR
ncbi:hypothetical protein OIU74_007207 [Salix koriyanagi]|uniref:Uncharacterized protein n=1 Tax=Salix koriyanagi TaxID=2511006 RepID=A0A9Q0U332_9ROSI|nr:hypothetical protein OIU74_007207 [Salix koriyanagi]